ncbi:MAG: hypothetical protein HPY66_1067 [Firmicutes bacterium]|nr:hypothetical protein [Bacillota bacterium]
MGYGAVICPFLIYVYNISIAVKIVYNRCIVSRIKRSIKDNR